MKLIVVSGRSGSGKSICLHVLEDLGYYCIDNLPTPLLPSLIEVLKPKFELLAVSIDARNSRDQLQMFPAVIEELREKQIDVDILFLDADNETLLKRYSQTHRKHPLTNQKTSLSEAVELERDLLHPIAIMSEQTINTNHLTLHHLRDVLYERLQYSEPQRLNLFFVSFGYKFGCPTDVDYIFDVRCLPNPHWEQGLSSFTGKDKEVELFLQKQPNTNLMLDSIITFLEQWIPQFQSSKRRYLTVGLGCTGGQHRSVYIAEQLHAHFANQLNTQIRHRELS